MSFVRAHIAYLSDVWYYELMKAPDLDKERSEELLSPAEFLDTYNATLPSGFPHASLSFLKVFKATYPALFKNQDAWSLGKHRKKVMDWLPQHLKSFTQ
jgi:hypothetical protein